MLRMGFKFPAAWFGPSNDVFKEKSNPGFTETIANDFAPLEFYCLILCSQFKAKSRRIGKPVRRARCPGPKAYPGFFPASQSRVMERTLISGL